MKVASVSEIKNELVKLQPKQLLELCLRLSRFKKENKELLSFLLFDAGDEQSYIETIKLEMDEAFVELNSGWYLAKKGLRKILRSIAKYSRFLKEKESEVQLLLHFTSLMKQNGFAEKKYKALTSLYETQLSKLSKLIDLVHEDLQYDYRKQLHHLQSK